MVHLYIEEAGLMYKILGAWVTHCKSECESFQYSNMAL